MNFNGVKEFSKKHANILTFLGLSVIFYFVFFHNIGSYALMDVDETRYVAMARDMLHSGDYLTLYLNGDYFFEKPPLYFWGECLSFLTFGNVSEFSARFPAALYGTVSCFLLYFVGKRVVSRGYGVISAIILATSLEFTILAKFAILDILLATCIGFSVWCGFLTYFCKEENKKHWWWLFYIFAGLGVLAKGIPGFVIPFGTMFFASIVSKRFKEALKPQYFLVGLFVFFSIVIPWHYVMLKMHDPLFFNEYILKHHLSRFIGSEELGREQPWYFFILTFIVGFIPWIFSVFAAGITKIKDLNKEIFKNFDFDNLTNTQKYALLNAIGFLVTLIFFSASTTKLITYILPIYFFSACLGGLVWYEFVTKNEFARPIKISVYIFNTIFLLAGVAAIFVQSLPLEKEILTNIIPLKWFCVSVACLSSILGIIFAAKNKRIALFSVYAALMIVLSAFGTPKFFNLDYKFGQNDLIEYAELANENNENIATFGFGRRYCVLYYFGGGKVTFQEEKDYSWLKNFISGSNSVVIIRNKDVKQINEHVDFKIVKRGAKYTLVRGRM